MSAADRAAALVLGWVGVYTRRLPRQVAEDRAAEIACDLWEQRRDGAQAGVASASVAVGVVRRMLVGVPADVGWRWSQQAAARRGPARVRIDGKVVVMNTRTPLDRVRLMLATRRCIACGERYRRRLPYCPVCKTKKGYDGVDHDPKWLKSW